MNWVVAIFFVAFAALGGEEFAHYRNPVSGPGVVASLIRMMPAGNLTAFTYTPVVEPVKKPAVRLVAPGIPNPVDFNQLSKNMDAMSPYKNDPDADKKADKVSLCIENVARKKLEMPLVSLGETPEQTKARKKSISMFDKMKMAKAAIDADSELINGCRRYLTG